MEVEPWGISFWKTCRVEERNTTNISPPSFLPESMLTDIYYFLSLVIAETIKLPVCVFILRLLGILFWPKDWGWRIRRRIRNVRKQDWFAFYTRIEQLNNVSWHALIFALLQTLNPLCQLGLIFNKVHLHRSSRFYLFFCLRDINIISRISRSVSSVPVLALLGFNQAYLQWSFVRENEWRREKKR